MVCWVFWVCCGCTGVFSMFGDLCGVEALGDWGRAAGVGGVVGLCTGRHLLYYSLSLRDGQITKPMGKDNTLKGKLNDPVARGRGCGGMG